MVVHPGVTCDGCGCMPIDGGRYRCLQCHDYDLCEECFKNKKHGTKCNHSAQHSVELLLPDGDIGFRSYHRIYCNGCGSEHYTGRRYRCLQCRYFDLCEFCYTNRNFGPNEGNHLTSHRMQVLLTPLDRQAIPRHDATCDGCHTNYFTGLRYSCTVCSYYDLCERCYSSKTYTCYDGGAPRGIGHSSAHKMIEMKAPSKTSFMCLQHQWVDLGRKIGFALYNAPTVNPLTYDWCEFGYDYDKEQRIKILRQKALELSKSHCDSHFVWVNFIFVSFWTKNQESMLPLLRVLKYEKDGYYYSYFIEPSGRTYDGWNDFIDKNKLPECSICYPKNGWYTFDSDGDCNLCFGESAECDTSRQLAKAGDVLATVGGVIGTGIAIFGLFTPLAPAAAATLVATTATAGTYGAGRSAYKLIDRGTHGESINPFDNKEAFFCWLGIVGTGIAFSSTAATTYLSTMAARGTHVSQFMRVSTTIAIFGNFGVNSFGLGIQIGSLLDKIVKGEEITALEIFQLSASILFLANQTLNIKTASEIIKNVQQQRFDHLRNFLTDDQRKAFDLFVQQNRANAVGAGNAKTGQMHGGETTIRAVNDAIANKNLSPLFQHYTNLPEFNSRDTKFSNVSANGEFPVRHGSEKIGLDHIVRDHGKQFAQHGYANNSDGILQGLRECMKDGNFLGFEKNSLQTFWKTNDPNKVLSVIFTRNPSGYLSNSFGELRNEILTAYFISYSDYQQRYQTY